MLKVEEAERIILDNVSELETVVVKISDALNMVLAEDIYSDVDIPPFDDSAMDGYAVKAVDTTGAAQESPVTLQVVGNVAAGVSEIPTITSKTAAKIMTGASLPNGADSVVMVEDTEENEGMIKIFRQAKVGENVRAKAEDVARGELVLKKGTSINAAEIGMLAALGREKVEVIRMAEVSIISTGNELIDVETKLKWGKKRDSNGYALQAQVTEAKALPRRVGIVPDEREKIKEVVLSALSSDVVIISGGVSMGDYDLVKEVIEEIGAQVKFTKVAIKPGKPFTFAIYDKKPIFALPGNPVSTMVCFEVFVIL